MPRRLREPRRVLLPRPGGRVAAITPFNDPLAMAAHKVGPALGAGNAVVLKPASATPLSALRLAHDLAAAGLPPGRFNVVTGSGQELATALVSDPRVRMVTFTGGVATGEHITRTAGIKKLSMELGSNSPVIVLPDANLGRAVPAIASGAFAQAGQNCLGVQRVFVHERIYADVQEQVHRARRAVDGRIVARRRSRRVRRDRPNGRQRDSSPGSRKPRRKAPECWWAVAGKGRVVWPTVLENVPAGVRIDCQEAYGPVVSLYRVGSLDEAIDARERRRVRIACSDFHATVSRTRLRRFSASRSAASS